MRKKGHKLLVIPRARLQDMLDKLKRQIGGGVDLIEPIPLANNPNTQETHYGFEIPVREIYEGYEELTRALQAVLKRGFANSRLHDASDANGKKMGVEAVLVRDGSPLKKKR